MTKNLPRFYWDACTWIALINKEMPTATSTFKQNRFEMCRSTIMKAEALEIELVTSAFTLAEVSKRPPDPSSPSINLSSFFDKKYILLTNVDKQVAMKAQSMLLAGVAGLKPADAVHLASALVANADVFHTFDDKLLSMNGNFDRTDGTTLKITRPTEEEPVPELLKRMQD
jgi:predicted nucleic acid-binding protein